MSSLHSVSYRGSSFTDVVKSVTESVSSSTAVQNDDELFFQTIAGELYEIILQIIYDSPAGGGTPDLKIDVGEDSTVRGQLNGVGVISPGNAASAFALAANQTNTALFDTTAVERSVTFHGYHRGNGGIWRLRWAQSTSDANATRVVAGSFLSYRIVTA